MSDKPDQPPEDSPPPDPGQPEQPPAPPEATATGPAADQTAAPADADQPAAQFAADAPPPPPAGQPPVPPQPKRPPHLTRTWLAAVIAGVLLLGGGVGGYFIGAANDRGGWHDRFDSRGDFGDNFRDGPRGDWDGPWHGDR